MAVFRCQKDCHQGARVICRRGHSMRVMVYAGRDPLTGKKKWVSRQVRGTGRAALKEAKQIEAQLVAEVAAGRHQDAQGVRVAELVEDRHAVPAVNATDRTRPGGLSATDL
jgi:integrase